MNGSICKHGVHERMDCSECKIEFLTREMKQKEDNRKADLVSVILEDLYTHDPIYKALTSAMLRMFDKVRS